MDSILEQLYHGELYPYAYFKPTVEKFIVMQGQALKSYTGFMAKLPEELKDEFTRLVDDRMGVLPYELEQNFIDGFRMGVRIMAEVYAEPSASLHKKEEE